ncbi:hypothetical protein [Kitasatospora sp. MBT63]|uniref:hypothetical protein n=1 Tax=Kitasatospora sp. MBT63 TaxID=1444768 RepID=UPI0011EA6B2E|nr:hypothetical protein [Kitasatospora sp. MBT63]
MCSWNGQSWPCWDDDLGWFSSSDGCYYHRSEPQPPAGDPAWAGHTAADGAVYEVNCRGVGGQLSTKPPAFFAQAPGGPPPDSPGVLANQAFAKMTLDAPELHVAPAGTAVVGSPVWFWYTPTPTTTGTQSKSASGNTLTMTATATLAHVYWFPDDRSGDGSSPKPSDGSAVDCKNSPGTPYTPGTAAVSSPTCGFVYKTASAKLRNDAYYLSVKLVWNVVVTRSDTGGVFRSFTFTRYSDLLALRVGEVQVLN